MFCCCFISSNAQKEPDIPKISGHPRRLTSLLITKQPTPQVLPCTCCIEWGHKWWTYSVRLWNWRWNFQIDYYCHIFLVAMEIMNFLICMRREDYIYIYIHIHIQMECKILWSHMIMNYNFIKPTTSQFTHGLFLSHYVSFETHNGHALPTPSCSFNMIVCWTKIHCCGQSSIQTSWVRFYFLKM